MKILHIAVDTDDGWYIAQGLEEPGLITQAKTLDELLGNIREVIELMEIGDKDLHIELIVPPAVRGKIPAAKRTRAKSLMPRKFQRPGVKVH